MKNEHMSSVAQVPVIILAAGCSRRMKRFKPLLPLGTSCILEHTISRFQDAGCRQIIAVVGHRKQELIPLLKKKGVRYVINPHYDDMDMFESVRLGISALPEDAEEVLLSPADIPLIMPYTIQEVVRVRRETGAKVVLPLWRETTGHPPCLDQSLFPVIENYHGNGGLHEILEQYQEETVLYPVPDKGMTQDTDLPEDYERLLRDYEHREIPDEETCREIWKCFQTPEPVKRHCMAVAGKAQWLGEQINQALHAQEQPLLDLPLLKAASLLHDMVRPRKQHALEAQKLLERMGYKRLGRVVGAHKTLGKGALEGINESTVLFLADRMVIEDQPCTIRQRYEESERKFQEDPAALLAVERDWERCVRCADIVRKLVGYDLFE